VVDLQEATRRDDVYKELEDIRLKVTALPVFPSLMWLWAYDIIFDIYTTYQTPDELHDVTVPEGITLKQVWDKFWEDVATLGLNMDLGGEIIEETIRDWMIDNNFLVALDEDAWLDDTEE
jgi:hypothetical protein